MLKLMFNANGGGYHHFETDELEVAMKNGWVDGEPIRQAAIAAKRKENTVTLPKPHEDVTIAPQVEAKRPPGRPRKETPSFLTGATNGDSPNPY